MSNRFGGISSGDIQFWFQTREHRVWWRVGNGISWLRYWTWRITTKEGRKAR